MTKHNLVDSPIITPLKYSYHKPERGLWVLNEDMLPIPWDEISDRQIVHFAPKAYGGNHAHPRREWFVAIGDLLFVWLDNEGNRHEEQMQNGNQLLLFTVPANIPHAVFNRSSSNVGMLWEFADGKLRDEVEFRIMSKVD